MVLYVFTYDADGNPISYRIAELDTVLGPGEVAYANWSDIPQASIDWLNWVIWH